MPNCDGTGPDGKGPMTGFGMGYCVIPVSSSEQELDILRNKIQILRTQLSQINNRIREVKAIKEVHHARI